MVRARLGPYKAASAMLVREPYSLGLAATAPTPGFGSTSSGTYPAPTQVPPGTNTGAIIRGQAPLPGSTDAASGLDFGTAPSASTSGFNLNNIIATLKAHWKVTIIAVAVIVVVMILAIPTSRRL